jgi:hypothetical protein
MDHGILKKRVEEACDKIAKDGIERCDDKDVILACFGMLMFNGIESLKKIMWTACGIGISIIISIALAVIFL